MSPSAIDRLIALASRRWLTGLRPVWDLGRILPRSVTYSDMTEKFCIESAEVLVVEPASIPCRD